MKIARLSFAISGFICLCLLATGCTTAHSVKSSEADAAVRKVDFSKAPELKDVAEHARQFGNEMYPKVCELFAEKGAKPPRRFSVVLKPLESGRTGETFVELRSIRMNSVYLTNNPDWQEIFDRVFVHEMAHMALRHNSFRWSRPHFGWEEGLADYAYFKLIGTNGWGCPQCDYCYPHYTSGYTCAGAFLLYLESTFKTNVAYQLNSELQRGRYSDAFFTRITGKKLDELWADFQKIPAFKPGAAEAFALYQTLGFGGAEPPKDALKRFKKYVDQHADDFTKHALKLSIVDGKEIKDVRILITEYLYFTQPGGSAEKAWLDLHKKSGMPGILEGEKGWMDTYFRYDEISSQKYPQSRTFQVRKRNDATSTYHYTMVRASVDSGWKLAKAWRAGTDGKTIEEFPVP